MLKALGAIIKDAVFPNRCCACGRLYRTQQPYRAKGPELHAVDPGSAAILCAFVCDTCIRLIQFVASPFCTQCGRPFNSPEGVDHLCGSCQQSPFDFAMARSVGVYAHTLKALVCAYKYQYRAELAVPLSRLLWQALGEYWDPGEIDCIIPVPLHRRRLRERGFNQAELLIRQWPELARMQGIAFGKDKLTVKVLVRDRHTAPQTGLDRSQRVANLQHAFRLSDPAAVRGRRVLLVDDVFTTGTTTNACAQVLNRAQAASVSVLTVARAV